MGRRCLKSRCHVALPSQPSWTPPPPPTTSPIFLSQLTPAGDTGFPFILLAAPQGSSGPLGHPGVSRGSRFFPGSKSRPPPLVPILS